MMILRRGLTLVELLVVVGILGILIATTAMIFNPARRFQDAKAVTVSTSMKSIYAALTQCLVDIQINPNLATSNCYWGTPQIAIYQSITSNTTVGIDLCPLILNKYLTVLQPDSNNEQAFPLDVPIGKASCQAARAYNLGIEIAGLNNGKPEELTIRSVNTSDSSQYLVYKEGRFTNASTLATPTPTPTPIGPTPTPNTVTGLTLRMQFNESSGSTAADSSPQLFTGAISPPTSWGLGKIGNGLTFGSGSRVAINDPGANSVFDVISGDSITLTAWVKRGVVPTAYGSILQKGDTNATGNRPYSLQIDASNGYKPYFGIYDGISWSQFIPTQYILPQDTWVHIAVRHTFGDGASTEFYINGTKVTAMWVSGTGNAVSASNDQQLWIGNTGTNESFVGTLDEVRMYKRYLSPNDILATMQ